LFDAAVDLGSAAVRDDPFSRFTGRRGHDAPVRALARYHRSTAMRTSEEDHVSNNVRRHHPLREARADASRRERTPAPPSTRYLPKSSDSLDPHVTNAHARAARQRDARSAAALSPGHSLAR
jgi:hypothetical protein